MGATELAPRAQSPELLKTYVVFKVTFNDALVTTVDMSRLPKTWSKSPAPITVQHIGDAWVAGGRSPVLKIPSVIVPAEWNYVINPAHPDTANITIGPDQPVRFDPRLLKT